MTFNAPIGQKFSVYANICILPDIAQAQPASSQAQLPGGSLLDGEFNEGESHAGFLEALKAFRGEKTDTAEESSKSVRFQGEND